LGRLSKHAQRLRKQQEAWRYAQRKILGENAAKIYCLPM
jgi:hypothetical protein